MIKAGFDRSKKLLLSFIFLQSCQSIKDTFAGLPYFYHLKQTKKKFKELISLHF
jgi:hypothetical protein